MAVFFRAVVMLVTLVGLPAAWVYYGPLPQGAQRVVDRFLEVTQDALGWQRPATSDTACGQSKTAPRFDQKLSAVSSLSQVSQAGFQGSATPARLASASEIVSPETAQRQGIDGEMQRHLSLLDSLGAEQYSLERWGDGYRFQCAMPLGDNPDFTRHFEAIHADSLTAVRQVVGEVSSLQNARHEVASPATIWR